MKIHSHISTTSSPEVAVAISNGDARMSLGDSSGIWMLVVLAQTVKRCTRPYLAEVSRS
jgi:hypothetical protein